MNVRSELLLAAQFYREAAAEALSESTDVDGAEFLAIVADWLTEEAGRHVHLNHLDSGYEEVPLWSHASMTPEVAALQPCVRMARLTIRTMMEVDDAA